MTTEAKAPDALLPCAHCGGDAHIGTTRYSRPLDNTWWADGSPIEEAFFAHCAKCAIGQRNSIAGGYQSANEAAEKWNRRAGQSHADAALLAALEAKNARLLELVSDFIFDDDPCFHDHHGYCQAHGWFCTDPCPHKRARAAIAAAKGGRDAG